MYLPNLFEEIYRVVAVESQSLTIEGVRSREVLIIRNENEEIPWTTEEFPLGTLLQLSDPWLIEDGLSDGSGRVLTLPRTKLN